MKKSLTSHGPGIQKVRQRRLLAGWLLLAVLMAGCGRNSGPAADHASFTPERVQELVELLGSKNGDSGMGFDLRAAAAEQLGEVGPRAKEFGAVAALEKLSKNRDPKIREVAARALHKIEPK